MAPNLHTDLEKVYDEYSDMLYRIALTHTADQHDAMDVVQDVFVKYATVKKKFDNALHEKAWLIRVTVNRAHDLSRKNKVRSYTPLDEVYDLPDEENNLSLAVREMLESLPEKYKTVLVLHYFEGFSVEETAGILDISVSAVKMRLLRAREVLNVSHKPEDFYE